MHDKREIQQYANTVLIKGKKQVLSYMLISEVKM